MRLGIDIDGCLANFNSSYIDIIVEVTGVNLFPEGCKDDVAFPTTWNYELDNGYTKEQVKKVWDEIVHNTKFWEKLEAYPDTKETIKELNRLAKKNHDVYFLTHRMGKNAKLQTETWLYNHGMNYPTVLLTGDKGPVLNNLGIKFFVDDKLETVNDIMRQGLDTQHFYLIDRPYNQKNRRPGVKSLPSILAALQAAQLVTVKETV